MVLAALFIRHCVVGSLLVSLLFQMLGWLVWWRSRRDWTRGSLHLGPSRQTDDSKVPAPWSRVISCVVSGRSWFTLPPKFSQTPVLVQQQQQNRRNRFYRRDSRSGGEERAFVCEPGVSDSGGEMAGK